jgi:hypothetical protein
LLERDDQITVVANWIGEVERERKQLERELGRKPAGRKALVRELKDIVAVLADADADPEDKRAIAPPNVRECRPFRPRPGFTYLPRESRLPG